MRTVAATAEEAQKSRDNGADGIGLCSTDQFFFKPSALEMTRSILIDESESRGREALRAIGQEHRQVLAEVFTIMDGLPVTVRLVAGSLQDALAGLPGGDGGNSGRARARVEWLRELNPLVGRCGCRIAISCPEIFETQVRSIFEAACDAQRRGASAMPEILVSHVMGEREQRAIVFGRRIPDKVIPGIRDIATEVLASRAVGPVSYRFGAGIGLPAAALCAGEIARYAQFFQIDCRQLTQMTLGICDQDCAPFMNAYHRLGLLDRDPFQVLVPAVREFVSKAVLRGRLTRPDLEVGILLGDAQRLDELHDIASIRNGYFICHPDAVAATREALESLSVTTAESSWRIPAMGVCGEVRDI